MRRITTLCHLVPIIASQLILLNACSLWRLPDQNQASNPPLQRKLVLANGDKIEVDHVVIIAIAGLKSSALHEYLTTKRSPVGGLSNFLGVSYEENALSFGNATAVRNGSSVFPSYTYPARTSIFTGVFPGAHKITGNMLFLRSPSETRSYTERHLDAFRVQNDIPFFGRDIAPRDSVKTLYEVVDQAQGSSIIIHNMVSRGAEKGGYVRRPTLSSQREYIDHHSFAFDENALWEAVNSLRQYYREHNALLTVMILHFAGLDHVEHLQGYVQAINYLGQLDELIGRFLSSSIIELISIYGILGLR